MPKTIRNKKRGSKQNLRNSRKKMINGGFIFDNVDIPNTGHVKIKINDGMTEAKKTTSSTVRLYNKKLRRLQIYNTGIKRFNSEYKPGNKTDNKSDPFVTFYAVSQGKLALSRAVGIEGTETQTNKAIKSLANVALYSAAATVPYLAVASATNMLRSSTKSDLRNDFGRSECYTPQPTYSFIERGLLDIFKENRILCSTACYIDVIGGTLKLKDTASGTFYGTNYNGLYAYIVFAFTDFNAATAYGSSWKIKVLGYYSLNNLKGGSINEVYNDLPVDAKYETIKNPNLNKDVSLFDISKKNQEFWYNLIPYVHVSFTTTFKELNDRLYLNYRYSTLVNLDKNADGTMNENIEKYNIPTNTRYAIPLTAGPLPTPLPSRRTIKIRPPPSQNTFVRQNPVPLQNPRPMGSSSYDTQLQRLNAMRAQLRSTIPRSLPLNQILSNNQPQQNVNPFAGLSVDRPPPKPFKTPLEQERNAMDAYLRASSKR